MCEPNNNVSENQDQTQTPTPPVAEDDAMSTRHSTDQTQPATKTAAVDDRLWGELEKYGLSTVEVRGSGSGDSGDVDDVIYDPELDIPKDITAELEGIADEAWSAHYGAYYDSDGGEATATFDVASRQLTICVGYYNTEITWEGSVLVA